MQSEKDNIQDGKTKEKQIEENGEIICLKVL